MYHPYQYLMPKLFESSLFSVILLQPFLQERYPSPALRSIAHHRTVSEKTLSDHKGKGRRRRSRTGTVAGDILRDLGAA